MTAPRFPGGPMANRHHDPSIVARHPPAEGRRETRRGQTTVRARSLIGCAVAPGRASGLTMAHQIDLFCVSQLVDAGGGVSRPTNTACLADRHGL